MCKRQKVDCFKKNPPILLKLWTECAIFLVVETNVIHRGARFRSRRSPITHRAATEAVVVMVRRVCRIWSMGTSFQGMGQWGVLSNWTRKDRGPAGCPGVV